MQQGDDSFMLVPCKGEDYMAGWHLDTKMAQDIVARTMRIIDTNINVMDARGRIIGSGDRERIGELGCARGLTCRCAWRGRSSG